MPAVIPPVPDGTDAYFWDGVQQHRLLVQRCLQCATLRLPPVPMCGNCHALEWDTLEVSGRGTVYSWILSKHPSTPDDAPRIVILVQLAEGPRIVSNLLGVAIDDIRNDMPVTLCFEEIDGVLLPQFRVDAAETTRDRS